MKKAILAILSGMCILSVTACGKTGGEAETTTEVTTEQTTQTEQETSEESSAADEGKAEEETPASASKLEIAYDTEEYSKEYVKIKYPVLKDMEDKKVEGMSNSVIKEQALAIAEHFDTDNNPEARLEVNIDSFYVTPDSKILSIVYTGTYSADENEEAAEDLRITTNIDLTKGNRTTLANMADAEKIAEILVNTDDYKIMSIEPDFKKKHKEYIKTYSVELLTEMLLNADFREQDKKIVYPEVFSNFEATSDYFVISVKVPAELGGHAEYLIDKSLIY